MRRACCYKHVALISSLSVLYYLVQARVLIVHYGKKKTFISSQFLSIHVLLQTSSKSFYAISQLIPNQLESRSQVHAKTCQGGKPLSPSYLDRNLAWFFSQKKSAEYDRAFRSFLPSCLLLQSCSGGSAISGALHITIGLPSRREKPPTSKTFRPACKKELISSSSFLLTPKNRKPLQAQELIPMKPLEREESCSLILS